MKFLSLFLVFTFILHDSNLKAQSLNVIPRGECSKKIKNALVTTEKYEDKRMEEGQAGFFVLMVMSPAFGLLLVSVELGLIGGVVLTKSAIKKHRKNMLEIFEGAASSGNKRTEKLWKVVNKKHKEAFEGMSYEKFLSAIHQADISGDACVDKKVPLKKDIVKVLVNSQELDLEDEMGERETTSKAARSSSEGSKEGLDFSSEVPKIKSQTQDQ